MKQETYEGAEAPFFMASSERRIRYVMLSTLVEKCGEPQPRRGLKL